MAETEVLKKNWLIYNLMSRYRIIAADLGICVFYYLDFKITSYNITTTLPPSPLPPSVKSPL